MKKGMSKVLSIVLSAAMVSPVLGMNPAKAMNPNLGPCQENSMEYAKNEIEEFFAGLIKSDPRIDSLSSEDRIERLRYSLTSDLGFCTPGIIAFIVSNLDNFFKIHSHQDLKSLKKRIVEIMAANKECLNVEDLYLSFLYCLAHALKNITVLGIDKEDLERFGDAIENIASIIKTLSEQRESKDESKRISKDLYCNAIIDIINKMSSGLTKDDIKNISSISRNISEKQESSKQKSSQSPKSFSRCSIM